MFPSEPLGGRCLPGASTFISGDAIGSILNPSSRSPKVTYRALAIGTLVLLANAATAVDVDPALAQVDTAVEVEAVAKGSDVVSTPSVEADASWAPTTLFASSVESSPDGLGETMPIGHAAEVAPCSGVGCSEGCTSGTNCHAFAKCKGGTCMPTEKKKTCLGTWMRGG